MALLYENMPPGALICDRWSVEEKIGRGGFGDVYRCKDNRSDRLVALKLVARNGESSGVEQLINEAKVLRDIQGKKFFTRFFSYKRTMFFDFIVMELLGENLRYLRKTQPGKKFPVDVTLSMARMMLKSVEWLHNAGYLHRDIKPANFAVGVGENANKVYLIDFGLCKRYVSESGELFALRNQVYFKGTYCYASANALNNKDTTRRDDLISLFYTLIDLSAKLPWKKIDTQKEMANFKKSYDHATLGTNFPAQFRQFYDQLNCLAALEKPNYGSLLSTLDTCLLNCSTKVMTRSKSAAGFCVLPGKPSSLSSKSLTLESTITEADVISVRNEDSQGQNSV